MGKSQMGLDFYNRTRAELPKKLFEKLLKNAEKILIKEKRIDGGQKLFIELSLVGNVAIKRINSKYRGKNRSTDVISLSYFNGASTNAFIGEIFICLPYASRQARDLRSSLNRELQFLFIHGLLHVFGYNHKNPVEKKKMERLTERILI